MFLICHCDQRTESGWNCHLCKAFHRKNCQIGRAEYDYRDEKQEYPLCTPCSIATDNIMKTEGYQDFLKKLHATDSEESN